MDISRNNVSNNELEEVMYYYQRNVRDLIDNMHEYNYNINTYLTGVFSQRNQRTPRYYTPNTSNRSNVFGNNVFQRQTYDNNLLRFTHHMDDVVVRPTTQQIENALETYNYVQGLEIHVCPITLENIQEGEQVCRIRHCNHIFKRAAIHNWFNRNVRCPVCRYDIRDYIAPPIVPLVTQPTPSTQETEEQSDSQIDDFSDLVRELINESTSFQTPILDNVTNNLRDTFSNAIRTFVNSELQRIPVSPATTELLYTFDLPLSVDSSGNYHL
jgi:hypothetical protein